jgi:hypothetical protein
MKLSIINVNGKCLSSDVVSIALIWLGLLLELAIPKAEIRHSTLLDRYTSKSLAGTQKTGPRQAPEFVRVFVHGRKQIEVTRGQIRRIECMAVACGPYHLLRANLLKHDLYELNNYRDESQVVFDAAPLLEGRLLVQVG